MFRSRAAYEIAPEWREDFLQFIADVGERPSARHKLFAADETRPIGPGNFVWKRSITEKAYGEDERTYQARAQRVYRAVRQEAFKEYDLKKLYGLSFKKFEAFLKEQDGKCAICGDAERMSIRGAVVRLAVDHCHGTKRVRGLLCSQCNRGLGLFRDKPELLEKAAEYIRNPKRLI